MTSSSGVPLSSIRVLLPVKPFAVAKSRLAVPPEQRPVIARRLFVHSLDVALQCLRSQQVLVMTDDQQVRRVARSRRVATVSDTVDDLNEALDLALLGLRRSFPHDTLAVMVADLPSLVAPALRAVLSDAASSEHPRHVVDQRGSGTTFVSIPPHTTVEMVFGQDSSRRFTDAGSVPMLHAPPAMTHDLDLLSDLESLEPRARRSLSR